MVTYKGFVTSTFLYMTQRYASVTPALQNYKRVCMEKTAALHALQALQYI